MARLKTAVRIGSTAPLVLGALALDPSTATALSCDTPSNGSLSCSDEIAGNVYVARSGDKVAVAYANKGIASNTTISAVDTICLLCEIIDPGPVKGHPNCISGFDPVVDDMIAEVVDALRTQS